MAIETGTIKSVTITDGECLCDVDFGANVIETCAFYENVGDNNYPIKGDSVVVSMTDGQNTILAVFRAVPGDLKQGEHVIYSRNSNGEIRANIKLTDAGIIDLNEGDDFAIMFNAFKKTFDQFVNDFNSHLHTGSTVNLGTGMVTIVPPNTSGPSTVDMSDAKVGKVKL